MSKKEVNQKGQKIAITNIADFMVSFRCNKMQRAESAWPLFTI